MSLEVQIVPLGNNIFTFQAEGRRVNLIGLTNPVTLVLTIGLDSGTTTATAEFQHRERELSDKKQGEEQRSPEHCDHR